MFELVPEPEFSAWLERLTEAEAEDVVGALEVVARADDALEPPGVSRALLWFDGTGAGASPFRALPGLELRLAAAADGFRALVAWQRELVSCLDSSAFRRRLERLSPAVAARALSNVEELRGELKRFQQVLWVQLGAGTLSLQQLERRRAAIKREFVSVLTLLGLEPGHFIALANGLRELTLTRVRPALRILFGVDAAAQCLIVLRGEALTRTYYGDSVRLAEARWASYQERALARSSP
jgi:hypothetical protein